MSEYEEEVKTYRVGIKCDDCDWKMTRIDDHNDHKYIYQCDRCKCVETSDIEYPYIKYVKKSY